MTDNSIQCMRAKGEEKREYLRGRRKRRESGID